MEPLRTSQLQVLGVLGRGAFGQVLKVRYRGKLYALKMVSMEKPRDLSTARNEAQVLAILSKSSCRDFITTITWYGRLLWPLNRPTRTYYALLMEYIPGPTLSQWLRKYGPLALHNDQQTFFRALAQLARTLTCLHRYGIVHKDIKPDNIIVRDDGRLYLVDYGLACLERMIDHYRSPPSLACPVKAGTPITMAPELVNRSTIIPEALDIWSLGITMYVLWTGVYPYRVVGRDPRTNQAQYRYVQPDFKILPPAVRVAIINMLMMDPSKRASAGQLHRFADSILT